MHACKLPCNVFVLDGLSIFVQMQCKYAIFSFDWAFLKGLWPINTSVTLDSLSDFTSQCTSQDIQWRHVCLELCKRRYWKVHQSIYRVGLVVNAFAFGSISPGLSPGPGYCVVFLSKKIPLVTSCYRNRDKLRPDGPYGTFNISYPFDL